MGSLNTLKRTFFRAGTNNCTFLKHCHCQMGRAIVKYSGTFGQASFEALQFTLPAADPGDTRQLLRRLLMTQISDIWEKYQVLGRKYQKYWVLSRQEVAIIVILSCSAWARVKCDTLFDRRKHPFHPFVSSKHPNLTLQCPKPSGLTLELQTKVRNNGEGPFSHLRHH